MSVSVILYFAVAGGSAYQACYKEGAAAQVCVPAVSSNGGQHTFVGLKEDADYTFSYKKDGEESDPMTAHTPKKKLTAPSTQIAVQ